MIQRFMNRIRFTWSI